MRIPDPPTLACTRDLVRRSRDRARWHELRDGAAGAEEQRRPRSAQDRGGHEQEDRGERRHLGEGPERVPRASATSARARLPVRPRRTRGPGRPGRAARPERRRAGRDDVGEQRPRRRSRSFFACPTGKRLIGGGARVNGGSPRVAILTSYPRQRQHLARERSRDYGHGLELVADRLLDLRDYDLTLASAGARTHRSCRGPYGPRRSGRPDSARRHNAGRAGGRARAGRQPPRRPGSRGPRRPARAPRRRRDASSPRSPRRSLCGSTRARPRRPQSGAASTRRALARGRPEPCARRRRCRARARALWRRLGACCIGPVGERAGAARRHRVTP